MGIFSPKEPGCIITGLLAFLFFIVGGVFVSVACDPYMTEGLCYIIGDVVKIQVVDATFTERQCVVCIESPNGGCVMDFNATCFTGDYSIRIIDEQQTVAGTDACRTIRDYADNVNSAKEDMELYQPGAILFARVNTFGILGINSSSCPKIIHNRHGETLGMLGYYFLCMGAGLISPVIVQLLYDLRWVYKRSSNAKELKDGISAVL